MLQHICPATQEIPQSRRSKGNSAASDTVQIEVMSNFPVPWAQLPDLTSLPCTCDEEQRPINSAKSYPLPLKCCGKRMG